VLEVAGYGRYRRAHRHYSPRPGARSTIRALYDDIDACREHSTPSYKKLDLVYLHLINQQAQT
jgi:hypothetical protein